MNKIQEMYFNISDEELKLAIDEIIESDKSGFIGELSEGMLDVQLK